MFNLALDAGHGLYTAGKRCLKSLDPNETREWVMNNKICLLIEKHLAEYNGAKILRVDDKTGATDVALETRAKKANDFRANLYLSIHHDSGISGGTGGGITSFIFIRTPDSTKNWQKRLYEGAVKYTGLKGNRSEPIRTAEFTVLQKTSMDAVLLECGFMDSATDVPIILSNKFNEECARGIVEAIAEMAGLIKKETLPAAVPTPEPDVKTEPAPEVVPEPTPEEKPSPAPEVTPEAAEPTPVPDKLPEDEDIELTMQEKASLVDLLIKLIKSIIKLFKK